MSNEERKQREHERQQQELRQRMMTVHEVAHLLHMNEDAVREWLRNGMLPGYRLGSDRAGWRVSPSELQAWLDARRGPSEPTGQETST